MIIDLSGKKAVVSASTAGIGLAIAKGLAACGAEIIINGRSRESVERALNVIRQSDGSAKLTGFSGDLATPRMCGQLLTEHPDCDILVNCLGIYALRDFFDTDDAEWERFFQTNVMSGDNQRRLVLRRAGRISEQGPLEQAALTGGILDRQRQRPPVNLLTQH
ncbi:SDR family oxidoreductase [Magnetospirillum sp. 15-1]|uniref:SDR family NAD(P)-dependent oxidoreductase n=1 Tax=Magnetospirillum sp. 15-1 TaxID=1979370 RepID=UPI000BBBF10E|nr:SDR family oxidoreductase [Magnetospirillum sp. 15-1]